MIAIRGAIFIEADDEGLILEKTRWVLEDMMTNNQIALEQIITITFSATKDLTKVYPAVAARSLGIVDAALFCVQEMFVQGSAKRCLRVLMQVADSRPMHQVKHSYLNGAQCLRPDWFEKKQGNITIAVDGPAGAGKSTVAKGVAKHLNLLYMDTGAMYRGVAYASLKKNIDCNDQAAVSDLVAQMDMQLIQKDGMQRVVIDGTDVTDHLREEAVGKGASLVSAIPYVREQMVALQQATAKSQSVIMDGRDIGTKVLINAPLKVYLDASAQVRAKRRFEELQSKGDKPNLKAIEADIKERDHRDMNRSHSPLKQAEDAVYIDTADMTIEAVIDRVIALYPKA